MRQVNRRPCCGRVSAARLDYAVVNAAALSVMAALIPRWLPDGKQQGLEWVARNPRRADRSPGSFKVNMATGAWADFATDARGRDVVSLAAYLGDLRQGEAARNLAKILGLPQ